MKSLARTFAWTTATSLGVMAVNFVTGVFVCRLLDPEGRGAIAAVNTWVQIFGWAAALGFYEAITWLRARGRWPADRLLGTALLVTLLFGTAGVAVGELLVPAGFAGQQSHLVALARWWMASIYLSVAGSMLNAMITGDQQFALLNLLRLLQPLAYLLGLLGLWAAGGLSVLGVLGVSSGCELLVTAYLLGRLARTVGIGRPSWGVLREGLRYGLRVQGALFAALANARLDLMLLPAILHGAAAIGLYSVSTNLSGLIVSLLGSFALIVFPAATRAGGRDGMALVARSLRFVIFGGLLGAGALFVACPLLLHWVYGPKFDGALPSLRLLLPGAVALAATKIVDGGLQAIDQPMKATWAQLAGLAVTLPGLYLTLGRWGIEGAALTSTASYAVSFLVSLGFLAREPAFSLREALDFKAFAADVTAVASKVGRFRRAALAPAAAQPSAS